MLAVVEDEQETLQPQMLMECGHERAVWTFANAEGRGDGLRHEAAVGERAQLHDEGSIGERLAGVGRHRERQASLPAAGSPSEGHQPRAGEHVPELADLALPAAQACQLRREVVAWHRTPAWTFPALALGTRWHAVAHVEDQAIRTPPRAISVEAG